MTRHLVLACLLLVVPVPVLAQETANQPESLLAEQTLFFFRFDGLATHRQAYEQSAFAEVMRGDLGKLLDYVAKFFSETVGPQLLKDQLLSGISPQQLQALEKATALLPDAFTHLRQHGVVLGFEFVELEPIRAQVTVIFPNAGAEKEGQAILSTIRLMATLANVQIKERKANGRTIFELPEKDTDPVKVAWWQEGKHTVLTIGTEAPEHTVGIVEGKRPNLMSSPLFQSVAGFKGYETLARGFIDFERGLKMARSRGGAVEKLIDTLGVGTLKSLTLQFGFEGRHERSTIAIHMPGPRKGLLKLAAAPESFSLDQLPPIPPDATSVSAFHLDLGTVYDTALDVTEAIVREAYPDAKERPNIRLLVKGGELAIGVDVRKNLLGAFGPMIVTYNAPSEGPFLLGTGIAIQVKDAERLQKSLATLVKSLGTVLGGDISLKKQVYRGVDFYTLRVGSENIPFPVLPTYTIHKNWFVFGLFPQTVQGYIFRSEGKYSAWKPSPLAQKVLADLKNNPKVKITSFSESDPRPMVKMLFSLAPFVGNLVNSFAKGGFDVAMIPNSQTITEPLFPNVSVSVDDGESIRFESYASMSIPFDIAGLDLLIAMGFIFPFVAQIAF